MKYYPGQVFKSPDLDFWVLMQELRAHIYLQESGTLLQKTSSFGATAMGHGISCPAGSTTVSF